MTKKSEQVHTIGARLPMTMVAELDAWIEVEQRRLPGARLTRSDAVRALLLWAIDARRREAASSAPEPASAQV